MRIRRLKHNANSRDAAFDSLDMFLLALAEEEPSLTQLVAMAPGSALECVRHVLQLTRLGLLDIDYDSFDEQLLLVRVGETAANEALDSARTLRPPPKHSTPDSGVLIANVTQPSSGMRARPTPANSTPRRKDA